MRRIRVSPRRFVLLLAALLAGCSGDSGSSPPLERGFVGPASLDLRRDIPMQSGTVATVRHGEPLEITQLRRRFVRVRAAQGTEGWTEQRNLLTAQELAALKLVAERARKLSSQGEATSYDALNVHAEPYRASPSFHRISEGEKVEVVWHRLAPRTAPSRPPLIVPSKAAPAPMRRKESARQRPTAPAPPKPPENWLELSKHSTAGRGLRPGAFPAGQEKPAEPAPVDDWSLVRTPGGQSGWVLSRRLYMAIPDEVAQYAEGRRITAYFPLGDAQDGGKRHWLWTTIDGGFHPYQFDSFRVFIWNQRRGRYETAYIERNLKGYFPTLVHPVKLAAGDTHPGFSTCIEKKDGNLYRRHYAFITNIVRFAFEEPCALPDFDKPAEPVRVASRPAPAAGPSLLAGLKQRVHALRALLR
ncbi:MAG: hypothetical protein FJW37_04980 [Acidobacteria bacterium]|nr:hypothetical protein [Acidobacteriota bacterium]